MTRKLTQRQEIPTMASVKKIYAADEVLSAITDGKLLNYYQPKVDTVTRKVIGVETLVRWFHPQDGMVYPDQFIGVAEAHGLIDDLTQVVLSRALAQTRVWQDEGILLHVSVNLSANSLGRPDFADSIVESSAKAGVPPQLVELEVAESCLKKESRTPMEVLARLRQKDFRLSINDFDIENSSLELLGDLPIDAIKLKPSIVRGARSSEILRNKIETTIGMAKQLGVSVVAVGVEAPADWDFLKKTGCSTSQGGLIAHPMPGPNLPGWIRSWHSTE